MFFKGIGGDLIKSSELPIKTVYFLLGLFSLKCLIFENLSLIKVVFDDLALAKKYNPISIIIKFITININDNSIFFLKVKV